MCFDGVGVVVVVWVFLDYVVIGRVYVGYNLLIVVIFCLLWWWVLVIWLVVILFNV